MARQLLLDCCTNMKWYRVKGNAARVARTAFWGGRAPPGKFRNLESTSAVGEPWNSGDSSSLSGFSEPLPFGISLLFEALPQKCLLRAAVECFAFAEHEAVVNIEMCAASRRSSYVHRKRAVNLLPGVHGTMGLCISSWTGAETESKSVRP